MATNKAAIQGAIFSTDANGNVTGLVGPGGLTGIVACAYQSFVPTVVPSSGTVATNGTITLSTALPTVYPNAWVYLPAGAISGGSAGLYFCTFSSTTVGQVYSNYASPSSQNFSPYIPSTVVAAIGSNSAYTQTTSTDLIVLNVQIPAGSMGANGSIRVTNSFSIINNGNTRSAKFNFGGILVTSEGGLSSCSGAESINVVRNRGVQNSQITQYQIGKDSSSIIWDAKSYTSVDTSQNQNFSVALNQSVSSDYFILEGYGIEIIPHI